mgnify:CR=1 FL=1
MKCKCENCGETKDYPDNKFSACATCDCGGLAKDIAYSPFIQSFSIKGVDYGYNEGLGVKIENRQHYKKVCKEKGVQPV